MQKPGAMSRFETTFRNAVASAERDVMIEQIRNTPQMSLTELGKLATGELGGLLKGITIGELLGLGKAKAPRAAATGTAKPSGDRKASGAAKGRGAKAKAKAEAKPKAKAEAKPKAEAKEKAEAKPKAKRKATLDRVGLKRNFDLLSQLDGEVWSVCKGF